MLVALDEACRMFSIGEYTFGEPRDVTKCATEVIEAFYAQHPELRPVPQRHSTGLGHPKVQKMEADADAEAPYTQDLQDTDPQESSYPGYDNEETPKTFKLSTADGGPASPNVYSNPFVVVPADYKWDGTPENVYLATPHQRALTKTHPGVSPVIAASKHLHPTRRHQAFDSFVRLVAEYENLFITEHAYHNTTHLAETIWVAANLAREEFSQEDLYGHLVILLMAAVFSNAGHPGGRSKTNQIPFETERQSVGFFKKWWDNNALFVQNMLDLDPVVMENAVTDMILYTDFHQGHDRVLKEYGNPKHRDHLYHGLKISRLKQLLNESDLLMLCMPHYSKAKIHALVVESGVKLSPQEEFQMAQGFIGGLAQGFFISNAARKLGIDAVIASFGGYMKSLNEQPGVGPCGIDVDLYAKFPLMV